MDGTAELEAHLKELGHEVDEARDVASEIATLVAYQQLLLAQLPAKFAALQKYPPPEPVPQFSRVDFPLASVMPESNLGPAYEIASLLWKRLAPLKRAGEVFLYAHKKFLGMLLSGSRSAAAHRSFSEFCNYPISTVEEVHQETPSHSQAPGLDKIQHALCLELPRDKVRLDKKFHPNPEVLAWLEEHMKDDVTVDRLKSLHEELVRTSEELENYLAEAELDLSRTTEFVEFPELDIIREIPEYRSLCASNERELAALQTDLIEFRDAFDSTVADLTDVQALFQGAYAWPELRDDEVEQLIRQQTDNSHRQRKLLVFKHIIQHASIKNPYKWAASEFVESEVRTLEKMKEAAKNGDFDAFQEAVSDEFERIGSVEEELSREKEEVNKAKAGTQASQATWLQKKTGVVYGDAMQELEASRLETQKRVSELTETRQAVRANLDSVAAKLAEVVAEVPEMKMMPDGFAAKLKRIGEKSARRDWLKAKVEAQRVRVAQIKDEIERDEKELRGLQEELRKKQSDMEDLEEKARTNAGRPLETNQTEERRAMYYCAGKCSIESKHRRDTILTPCGHTFCKECVGETIKSRTRMCPYCGQKFNPGSEVLHIKWPKVKG